MRFFNIRDKSQIVAEKPNILVGNIMRSFIIFIYAQFFQISVPVLLYWLEQNLIEYYPMQKAAPPRAAFLLCVQIGACNPLYYMV